MKKQAIKALQYTQYASGNWKQSDSGVIVEQSVTLTVNGKAWITLQCTPVDLEVLAVGFLFNEGLIHTAQEIHLVEICASSENVDVWLSHKVDPPKQWRRISGCSGGVTAAKVDQERQTAVDAIPFCLPPERVCSLINQLLDEQGLYRQVRGVHASALSDGERLLVVMEDVGRHNTIDKISGHRLLFPNEGNATPAVLLTTGRISSDMLQKAQRIGAVVVISRSSPTSLSVQMAEQQGITLIGYAHRDHFNLYTHPERVSIDADYSCPEACLSHQDQ